MWLPQQIVSDVSDVVDEIFYLSFDKARSFNEHRKTGVPLVFSGWYWAKGRQEGGPFKSQSSAYRDAYYRLVRKQAPPLLHGATSNIVALPRARRAA